MTGAVDQLTVRKSGSAMIVALPKSLDGSNGPAIQLRLEQEFVSDMQSVVIDCSRTDFISSAGIRVLVAMARRTRQAGGKIRAFGLSPVVRQVFDFSGITTVIATHLDMQAAMEGCA
jgi:stage II sporulation protein AA (anti-sigma F factor antagonist)